MAASFTQLRAEAFAAVAGAGSRGEPQWLARFRARPTTAASGALQSHSDKRKFRFSLNGPKRTKMSEFALISWRHREPSKLMTRFDSLHPLQDFNDQCRIRPSGASKLRYLRRAIANFGRAKRVDSPHLQARVSAGGSTGCESGHPRRCRQIAPQSHAHRDLV